MITTLLYIGVIFCLFIVCVRKDLRTKYVLCISSLVLGKGFLFSFLLLLASTIFNLSAPKSDVLRDNHMGIEIGLDNFFSQNFLMKFELIN